MEPILYTVTRIDGEYAHLLSDEGVENTVAMALLPLEITEGGRLRWEAFAYTLLPGEETPRT